MSRMIAANPLNMTWLGVGVLLVAGCSATDRQEAAQSTTEMTAAVSNKAAPTPPDPDTDLGFPADAQLAGRWTGPEGLYADVKPEGDGRYTVIMQYNLDSSGTFPARRVGNTLEMQRPDGPVSLSYGAGAETGMKWVAPGAHCLIAKVGEEAYCRPGL